MRYSMNGRRFQTNGIERIEVERHQQCQCRCITKRSDCAPGQQYDQDQCRCICPIENRLSCMQRFRILHQSSSSSSSTTAATIRWNPLTCQCECVSPGGDTFNHTNGKCINPIWLEYIKFRDYRSSRRKKIIKN